MRTWNKATRWAVAGLLAWYVCTLLFWAVRPFDDRVPVGVDATLPGAPAVTVTVRCHSLFADEARGPEPLPALTPQPEGRPALAYARTPCARPHGQARALLVFDTVFVVAALGAVVWFARRRHDTPARA